MGRLVQLRDGRLMSGRGDETIRVWDLNTGNLALTLPGHTEKVAGHHQLTDPN